jgi:hypothetical protein
VCENNCSETLENPENTCSVCARNAVCGRLVFSFVVGCPVGDRTSRLALMESAKSMPLNAVWEYLCMQAGVSVDCDWIADVKDYEAKVTSRRS